MRPSLLLLLASASMAASSASAATYTEDFSQPLHAWEANWFGLNSDARNYYGDPNVRTTPDGMWLRDSNNNAQLDITFIPTFAGSLTSFQLDVASWVQSQSIEFYDASGALISTQLVIPTFGGYENPGRYNRYGTTSAFGIGRIVFTGNSLGNVAVDNLLATTRNTQQGVPEPAAWAMMICGFGMIGTVRRQAWTKTQRLVRTSA